MRAWRVAQRTEVMAAVRLEYRAECRMCDDCHEADFLLGGLCRRHEERFEQLVKETCAKSH